jgi:hypothetical protein
MALNFGLQASFDNMQHWREIGEKAEEVNKMKAIYKTKDETSR